MVQIKLHVSFTLVVFSLTLLPAYTTGGALMVLAPDFAKITRVQVLPRRRALKFNESLDFKADPVQPARLA